MTEDGENSEGEIKEKETENSEIETNIEEEINTETDEPIEPIDELDIEEQTTSEEETDEEPLPEIQEENEPKIEKQESFIEEQIKQNEEQPCDPLTMTCDEIQNKVTTQLIPESIKYEKALDKLNELKQITPSEELDKAYDSVKQKQEEINNEIYGLFEKHTICKTKPKIEEENNPELE